MAVLERKLSESDIEAGKEKDNSFNELTSNASQAPSHIESNPTDISNENDAKYRSAFSAFSDIEQDAAGSIAASDLEAAVQKLGLRPTKRQLQQYSAKAGAKPDDRLSFTQFVSVVSHCEGSKGKTRAATIAMATGVLACMCVVWLALLTAAPHFASGGLQDPTMAAIGSTCAFISFQCTTSSRLQWSLNRGSMMSSMLPWGLMWHLITLLFILHRVFLADGHAWLEAARVLLLYALLGVLFGLGCFATRQITRHQAQLARLTSEVLELRKQASVMKDLLAGNYADDDESDVWEGDSREHMIVPPSLTVLSASSVGDPQLAMAEALNGQTYDGELAEKIAARMRKPNYSLPHFYEDIRAAFPELQLYCVAVPKAASESGDSDDEGNGVTVQSGTTSGVTWDTEYRRTIGALFAVYWLMRVGIDGERGFSFGVDEQWAPREPPVLEEEKEDEEDSAKARRAEAGKRLSFYKTQDWGRLQKQLAEAGMLTLESSGEVTVNIKRTVAMLALTAFHDIMKVEALLPKVPPHHAPFHGYKEGDVVGDHDIALAYVLDYHPNLLPSFEGLTVVNQKSVRFTQSKMQFNHGWLVQGEAPPAPLFAKFKEVLQSDDVAPADVAFYFVHWLTDLAGAEPSPLGGGEKFVLKFPHPVLDAFIRSFSVLNELAVCSETQVMEDYLVRTWREMPNNEMTLPEGEDSIAKLRLFLHVQTPEKKTALMEAYDDLHDSDSRVLTTEMARSGIADQICKRGPSFKQAMGPAFLVYYGPALLTAMTPMDALSGLQILAEVYRRARQLWPLEVSNDNKHSVTIRVDQLKGLKLTDILEVFSEGWLWILVRKNDNEAVVEKLEVTKLRLVEHDTHKVLKFHRIHKDHKDGRSRMGGSKTGTHASGLTMVSASSGGSNESGARARRPVALVSGSISRGKKTLVNRTKIAPVNES